MPSSSRVGTELVHCVSHALMAGRRVPLLRVLLTNLCWNDCAYCAFRSQRDTRRLAFRPEELARGFDQMRRAGLVKGLFLSSGLGVDPMREMDRMLATVEMVREHYEFRGYVHLKILPGSSPDQIERAVQLADRVSTNLEAPNPERLALLSKGKVFENQLMAALRGASRSIRSSGGRLAPAGVATQFVVGAVDESDREILSTSAEVYRTLGLARIYYSRFGPVPDTPLEGQVGTPLAREHRLYQADFLLRRYGFEFESFVFDERGNLPAGQDPKLAWARAHPEAFPIEVNLATRPMLLQVPGIGPVVADRILRERQRGTLSDLAHLRKMGARVDRVAPYVLLDGRRPARQLPLWREVETLRT